MSPYDEVLKGPGQHPFDFAISGVGWRLGGGSREMGGGVFPPWSLPPREELTGPVPEAVHILEGSCFPPPHPVLAQGEL